MICPKCGTDNVDNAAHCMICGSPLSYQNPQAPKKSAKNILKPIIFGVVGVIVLIAVIACITSLLSDDKYIIPEDNIWEYETDEEIRYMFNDEQIYVVDKEKNYVKSSRISVDQKVLYVLEFEAEASSDVSVSISSDSMDETEPEKEKGGSLVRVDKKGSEVIDSDVRSIGGVSRDGEIVYYETIDDEIFQFNGKEPVKLDIDKDKVYLRSFIYSPNGEYAAYVCYDKEVESEDSSSSESEEKETVYTAYIFGDGETTKIDKKNFFPLTITDNGKSLYGYTTKEVDGKTIKTLLALVKDEFIEIGKYDSLSHVNADYTQIMYEYEDKTYMSLDFEPGIKIGNESWDIVVPDDAVGVSDLREHFYVVDTDDGDDLYYLEKVSEKEVVKTKVEDSVSKVEVNSEGDTVYYKTYNSLRTSYRLNVANVDDLENPVEVMRDYKAYAFTDDGKYVYYINEDKELYVTRPGKDEDIKLTDEVEEIAVTLDGDVYIMKDVDKTGEGELYYTKGTDKPEKVSTGVRNFYILQETVYFKTNYNDVKEGNDTYDIKIANGTKTEDFLKDVTDVDF